MIVKINVKSTTREEFVDITGDVQRAVEYSGVTEGICYVFVPHTTAGVTINEGADPSVKRDILVHLNKAAPISGDYRHMEGNSDAHIKASMMGSSEAIFVEKGSLNLGTWQSIYFCEFDGPRTRQVSVKLIKG